MPSVLLILSKTVIIFSVELSTWIRDLTTSNGKIEDQRQTPPTPPDTIVSISPAFSGWPFVRNVLQLS